MMNKLIGILLLLVAILSFKSSYKEFRKVDDGNYTTVLNIASVGFLILVFSIGFLTTKVPFCEAYPKICNILTIE